MQPNKGEDIILEPEEKTYVLELMDEEKELSAELTEKSKICTQQEIQILQMRQEVAENLCKISGKLIIKLFKIIFDPIQFKS